MGGTDMDQQGRETIESCTSSCMTLRSLLVFAGSCVAC